MRGQTAQGRAYADARTRIWVHARVQMPCMSRREALEVACVPRHSCMHGQPPRGRRVQLCACFAEAYETRMAPVAQLLSGEAALGKFYAYDRHTPALHLLRVSRITLQGCASFKLSLAFRIWLVLTCPAARIKLLH